MAAAVPMLWNPGCGRRRTEEEKKERAKDKAREKRLESANLPMAIMQVPLVRRSRPAGPAPWV